MAHTVPCEPPRQPPLSASTNRLVTHEHSTDSERASPSTSTARHKLAPHWHLAGARAIREVVYDPMRFESEALRLERDHALPLVSWSQSESRMTICSEKLHGLVVEQRPRHPGGAELDRHVANAVAKPTPRGWRLVKSAEAAQIDAVIALAMAAERAPAPRARHPPSCSAGSEATATWRIGA